MSLYIRDTTTVPDGGFRYPGVLPGTFIVYPYGSLYDEIKRQYTANNVPVPRWDEVVIWMCNNLSIPCVDGNQPLVNKWTQGLPSLPLPSGCCSAAKKVPTNEDSI